MARDDTSAARLRAALKRRRNVAEKPMFGGVCFMLRDHMLCVSGSGGFMFRVGTEREIQALARPGVRRVIMRGREYPGFVWVDPARYGDAELPGWIALAEGYIKTLPPKTAKKKPAKKKAAKKTKPPAKRTRRARFKRAR